MRLQWQRFTRPLDLATLLAEAKCGQKHPAGEWGTQEIRKQATRVLVNFFPLSSRFLYPGISPQPKVFTPNGGLCFLIPVFLSARFSFADG